MRETHWKQDKMLSQMMTLMKLCWISLGLVTFLGVSLFLDSRWWWKETNTKESNGSGKMQKRAMRLQNSLQECRLTKMIKSAEETRISSQLNKVKEVTSNFLPSNLLEPDQCQISEVCKKLLSQKWNSLRNRRTPLFQDHSSLVKQDQVLT